MYTHLLPSSARADQLNKILPFKSIAVSELWYDILLKFVIQSVQYTHTHSTNEN